MEILIIIAYIANVFLNRYLNKVAIKYYAPKVWLLWFIPIATALAFLIIIIISVSQTKFNNWFTGKYW